MKTWNMPVVKEVEIKETSHGGEYSMDFDSNFYDQNGALKVTFAGNTES